MPAGDETILLYASDRSSEQYRAANRFLAQCTAGPAYTGEALVISCGAGHRFSWPAEFEHGAQTTNNDRLRHAWHRNCTVNSRILR